MDADTNNSYIDSPEDTAVMWFDIAGERVFSRNYFDCRG